MSCSYAICLECKYCFDAKGHLNIFFCWLLEHILRNDNHCYIFEWRKSGTCWISLSHMTLWNKRSALILNNLTLHWSHGGSLSLSWIWFRHGNLFSWRWHWKGPYSWDALYYGVFWLFRQDKEWRCHLFWENWWHDAPRVRHSTSMKVALLPATRSSLRQRFLFHLWCYKLLHQSLHRQKGWALPKVVCLHVHLWILNMRQSKQRRPFDFQWGRIGAICDCLSLHVWFIFFVSILS